MNKRLGFTLIELLVVIAIIAILAAILFPVFLSTKTKARTIKCLSHGKQIGNATMLYLSDSNDRFPSNIGAWPEPSKSKAINYLTTITWVYTWNTNQPNQIWNAYGQAQWRYIQLYKYTKNEDIWICPDPTTMYSKRYAYGFRCSWLPRTTDDFVNGDRGFNDDNGIGRTISEVAALDAKGETACGKRYMPPTRKIMWMCYALGSWAKTNVGNPPGVYPWIFPSFAHGEGSVFIYTDGHAEWKYMGSGWSPYGYTALPIDNKHP